MNVTYHVEVVDNKKDTTWNPEVVRRTKDTADSRGLYMCAYNVTVFQTKN
jgi:hypothetical protein